MQQQSAAYHIDSTQLKKNKIFQRTTSTDYLKHAHIIFKEHYAAFIKCKYRT